MGLLDAGCSFQRSQSRRPRLQFTGGTSLSKAYGLISRFSEDIDITVFRDDIGQAARVEELESLSGKKRGVRLDAIRVRVGSLSENCSQQFFPVHLTLNKLLKKMVYMGTGS